MKYKILALVAAGLLVTGCQVKPVENSERVGNKGRTLLANLSGTTDPQRIPSVAQQKRFWSAADNGQACQAGAELYRDKPVSVNNYSIAVLKKIEWQSPFARQLPAFNRPWLSSKPPSPIVKVRLNEAYGERQVSVDMARDWFLKTSLSALHPESSNESRGLLKAALLEWARADGLSKGIRVSWGNKPVDWQVLTLRRGVERNGCNS